MTSTETQNGIRILGIKFGEEGGDRGVRIEENAKDEEDGDEEDSNIQLEHEETLISSPALFSHPMLPHLEMQLLELLLEHVKFHVRICGNNRRSPFETFPFGC